MKKILSYGLPIFLAGLLLWYTHKDMEFADMWEKMKEAHVLPVALTFVSTLVAHFLRAIRWNMLFQPLGYQPKTSSSFLAVMSGYFANLVIPRGGEITRCTALYTSERIPVQTSIGSVIAERGLDLAVFGVLTVGAFLLEYQTLVNFIADVSARLGIQSSGESGYTKMIVLSVGLLAVALIYLFRKKLAQNPFLAKMLQWLTGFMEGLLSVTKLQNPGLFMVYTVIIWTCYFFTTYISLSIFDFTTDLGLKAAFLLLVIGSFGIILPVPAAAGGPFQAFVSAALILLYKKDSGLSTVAADTMYYSQQLLVVVAGGICYLLQVWLANKKIEEEEA